MSELLSAGEGRRAGGEAQAGRSEGAQPSHRGAPSLGRVRSASGRPPLPRRLVMGAQPMPFPSDHPTNRLDHDPRTALRGPAYEWPLWSTTMRVVTADSHALPSARRLVETELAHVELAASRGRRDAEVSTLPTGRRTRISGTLAAILGAALRAAEATEGIVDPTTGRSLRPVGDGDPWRGIELDEAHQTVLLPRGV